MKPDMLIYKAPCLGLRALCGTVKQFAVDTKKAGAVNLMLFIFYFANQKYDIYNGKSA